MWRSKNGVQFRTAAPPLVHAHQLSLVVCRVRILDFYIFYFLDVTATKNIQILIQFV